MEKSLDACEGDEEKLELLQLIGCGCSEYITGAYSSNILEREIVKIGQIIEFSPEEKPQNGKILHVMTRAGKAGGHSTIVYNWIKNDKKRQYSIVFTDMEYWDIKCRENRRNDIMLTWKFSGKSKTAVTIFTEV